MPEPYFTIGEARRFAEYGVQAGLSDEEVREFVADRIAALQQERRSEEFSKKSTLGQLWWATKRGWKGSGEQMTAALGKGIEAITGKQMTRSPAEVYAQATQDVFSPVQSAVLPDAPNWAKVALPLVAETPRALSALHVGAGHLMTPAARVLGMAKVPGRVQELARTAGAFEALGQLEDRPTGSGAATGVALSALPLLMTKSPRFQPPITPLGANPYALPLIPRAGAIAGGAVAGLTARDMMAGKSLPEQFDLRTPEGRASIMEKGIAAAFVGTGHARMSQRAVKEGLRIKDRLIKEADELVRSKLIPETAAIQKLRGELKQIDPIDLAKVFKKTNDVVLKNLAKSEGVEIPRDFLSQSERTIRALGRPMEQVDLLKPGRTVFADFRARMNVIDRIHKKLGGNVPSIYRSLTGERNKTTAMYRLLRRDVQPIEPSTYPTKEGWPRSVKGKIRFEPLAEGMRAPKEMRQLMSKTYAAQAQDLTNYFRGMVDPARAKEVLRLRSLRELLGHKVGTDLYKFSASKPRGTGYELHDLMPAETYAKFREIFRGQTSHLIRNLDAEHTRITGVPRDIDAVLLGRWESPRPDETRTQSADQVLEDASFMHKVRRGGQRFNDWAERHPQDRTDLFHYLLSHGETQARRMAIDVDNLSRWIWLKDLPAQSMTKRWLPFREYMLQTGNPKVAKRIGIKDPTTGKPWSPEAVAKRIKWIGTTDTLNRATQAAWKRFRTVYDWLFSQSGIGFDRYVDEYFPLLVNYVGGGMEMPLDQYLAQKGKLPKSEAKHFTQLLREMAEPPAIKIMKDKMPFYEHPRKPEKEMVKWLTYEKDPIVGIHKYGLAMARRKYKGPLLPVARDLMNQIAENHAGQPGGGAAILSSMNDYLEGWWRRPSTFDRLYSARHPMARSINWFRNHVPGGRTIPEITGKNSRGISDFFDFVTTSSYGATMGLKASPVLKNLLQQGHNVVVHGPKQTLRGMGRFFVEPAFRKRVVNAFRDVRYQVLDVNPRASRILNRMAQKITATGLIPFRMGDRMNVYGALAPAIDRFDQVEKLLKGKPTEAMKGPALETLSLRRIPFRERIMPRFRKLPGLDKHYKATWRGTEPFGNLIWRDIMAGNMARARTQYYKWSTYLSQWSYGSPESPPIFRGSINRMLLMYKSWPMHYGEFLYSMSRSPMGREWLRLSTMWLATLGAGAAVGIPFWKWIMAGPFPRGEDIFSLESPAVKLALLPYNLTRALLMGTQQWMVSGADDIHLLTAEERVLKVLEQYEEQFIAPYQRQLEAFQGERPLISPRPRW